MGFQIDAAVAGYQYGFARREPVMVRQCRDRRLFQSTDAGRHWSLLGTIGTAGRVGRMHFVNEHDGFTILIGPQGQNEHLQTADGGRSWNQIPSIFAPL
jgi:photosystem II stability/assembly factor-like uncharacterized protein